MICLMWHFNPRSHEGSDYNAGIKDMAEMSFQSTLPRRERPSITSTIAVTILDFNPRSHEGSDDQLLSQYFVLAISIHAPTKGATEEAAGMYYKQNISIHAPTKGATTAAKS